MAEDISKHFEEIEKWIVESWTPQEDYPPSAILLVKVNGKIKSLHLDFRMVFHNEQKRRIKLIMIEQALREFVKGNHVCGYLFISECYFLESMFDNKDPEKVYSDAIVKYGSLANHPDSKEALIIVKDSESVKASSMYIITEHRTLTKYEGPVEGLTGRFVGMLDRVYFLNDGLDEPLLREGNIVAAEMLLRATKNAHGYKFIQI